MGRIMEKIWCCGAKTMPSSSKSDIADLPKGHVRVYVGKDEGLLSKFEIEANYLNLPLFENLLRISEEEFGYSYDGALRIACDINLFQYVLHLLKTNNPSVHSMDLPDLVSKFHGADNGSTHGSIQDNEVSCTKDKVREAPRVGSSSANYR